MSGFEVQNVDRDGIAAIEVSAPGTASVTIARVGATLLSWRATTPSGTMELTDGYRSLQELLEQDGVRNGILAPFSNRIADGRYTFGPDRHDLLPCVPGPRRLIYHGFARLMAFDLDSVVQRPSSVVITLRAEIGPRDFAGYPYSVAVSVAYTISADRIALQMTATNTGDVTAPCGLGWHAYFRLSGTTIDQLTLQVPAGKVVTTDRDLIPVGTDPIAPLASGSSLDLRRGSLLDQQVVDRCYTDLSFDRNGLAVTTLQDLASGDAIEVWQDRGHLHVFTGDTLQRGPRQSVALEPVEFITDAFNRPELAAAVALLPGATRVFRCGARLRRPEGGGDESRVGVTPAPGA